VDVITIGALRLIDLSATMSSQSPDGCYHQAASPDMFGAKVTKTKGPRLLAESLRRQLRCGRAASRRYCEDYVIFTGPQSTATPGGRRSLDAAARRETPLIW